MRYRLIVIHDGTDVGAWPTVGIESRLFLIAEVVVHAHVVADLVSNNLSKKSGLPVQKYKKAKFLANSFKKGQIATLAKMVFHHGVIQVMSSTDFRTRKC